MPTPYTQKELGPMAQWAGKTFTAQDLGLSGSEISFNRFPPNQAAPFVHSHKLNEEVYIVLQGSGWFYLDGQEHPITEGSILRVAAQVLRAWKAGDAGLTFICIQAQEKSLTQATRGDGVRHMDVLPSWGKS